MSDRPPRVVFDCVVYIQALISGSGPSAACVEQARQAIVGLFISPFVMAEIRGVSSCPTLTRKYRHLTPKYIETFIRDIEQHAVSIENPPAVFDLPRDPKDEPYINLGVAVDAQFLVTWNAKHLTYLMRKDTPEGRLFCEKFPKLKIVSPPEFLHQLRQATA
jgi:putative PIN family toxin of toxin-antitoxin system